MSQKSQSDGGQKHFAVGRGLLAAAETLNFSMNEQRSGRQFGGVSSGVGVGGGGMEGQGGSLQMSQRGGGSHLSSTMKLFASLGLSPSDLDALAEIPEEDISVETLPRILTQLKSRKAEAAEHRAASSMSSDAAYGGGGDGWDDMPMGRMGGSSMGQGSGRVQASADFGFSSVQDMTPGRGFGRNYGSDGGGGAGRERAFSELSHRDSYSGLGMPPPTSEPVFMQRRMGSPSNGKVQDFLGVTPTMFPHVCSLCDFDVHSIMEWNQHINGLKHAENRRLLLNMYPEWDPGMLSGGRLMDSPNLSAGILGPAPMSSIQSTAGLPSSWGGGGAAGVSGNNHSGQNKLRGRVVVVKYDRKPLSNKTLFAFCEPFGTLREHLVLKNKAFLELSSHEEAVDMVNYYKQNSASLYGKPVSFYLSKTLLVIEKDERSADRSMDRPVNRAMDRPLREAKGVRSQVVFFSNLPREEEKKKELLTIARRFGTVEKHLFLTDQAFVQLGTPGDAEMLVKYYSMNPLTIKGRRIRLNICTKYKTLDTTRRLGNARNQKSNTSSSTRTSSSFPRASKSSSSSRSKEEKKKKEREEEEEKEKLKEQQAAAEDEEVAGVMEGEEDEEKDDEEQTREQQVAYGDREGEEPEAAESVQDENIEESEDAPQEELSGAADVTHEAAGDMGGNGEEAKRGAGSESQPEATDKGEDEDREEEELEATESCELEEGDGPADVNMEDFVTLDELAEDEDEVGGRSTSIDNTRRGGMRVVNIVGFRRGYNFLNELLGLAKPFGKVVKHLVLDLRAEAYLQFETEEEARAMSKFYSSNVTASVCGRPVRISHSTTYPTIQCGSSKVVYIGGIPTSKFSDQDILNLALPFGKIHKYFTNRLLRECFVEMESAEDAERMGEHCKEKALKYNGKRLTVYVSRKYRQLKHGHRCPTAGKRDNRSTSPKASEPPAKKPREEEENHQEAPREEEQEEQEEKGSDVSCVDGKNKEISPEKIPQSSDQNQPSKEGVKEEEKQQQQQEVEISANRNEPSEALPPQAEPKASVASLPLPSYDPSNPIGVEHVKMGYYCRVCFLFYSNEDTAKKTHCSSKAHYDKLQKHLEKEQSRAEKKKVKTT